MSVSGYFSMDKRHNRMVLDGLKVLEQALFNTLEYIPH